MSAIVSLPHSRTHGYLFGNDARRTFPLKSKRTPVDEHVRSASAESRLGFHRSPTPPLPAKAARSFSTSTRPFHLLHPISRRRASRKFCFSSVPFAPTSSPEHRLFARGKSWTSMNLIKESPSSQRIIMWYNCVFKSPDINVRFKIRSTQHRSSSVLKSNPS